MDKKGEKNEGDIEGRGTNVKTVMVQAHRHRQESVHHALREVELEVVHDDLKLLLCGVYDVEIIDMWCLEVLL